MQVQLECRQCGAVMQMLDLFMEGGDWVCMRCGIHEVVRPELQNAPPCYQ